ncbi:hypothetical protein NQ318_011850 [Aromia moschata]|uniref:Reverse transcriptase RNase H-like domain-containing protein n=1 Tax=Aromia moschata TaxID=1265417 RepID=A0AAV8XFL7_9CUCU|nr:hypothetical protein NQ318_011850 [Aromia moschata]
MRGSQPSSVKSSKGILGISKLARYLYGRHFLIRTDHNALQWIMNFKNPEGQVARWMERLATV